MNKKIKHITINIDSQSYHLLSMIADHDQRTLTQTAYLMIMNQLQNEWNKRFTSDPVIKELSKDTENNIFIKK